MSIEIKFVKLVWKNSSPDSLQNSKKEKRLFCGQEFFKALVFFIGRRVWMLAAAAADATTAAHSLTCRLLNNSNCITGRKKEARKFKNTRSSSSRSFKTLQGENSCWKMNDSLPVANAIKINISKKLQINTDSWRYSYKCWETWMFLCSHSSVFAEFSSNYFGKLFYFKETTCVQGVLVDTGISKCRMYLQKKGFLASATVWTIGDYN